LEMAHHTIYIHDRTGLWHELVDLCVVPLIIRIFSEKHTRVIA